MQDVCTDAEMLCLLKDAQNGMPAAYDRLYTLYADKLFRFLLVRTGQREAAEDLVADTFVRLIQALPRFRVNAERPVASFSAWLYRVAGNLAADWGRRQGHRRHADLSDHAHLVEPAPSPFQRVAAAEEEQLIAVALAQLGEEQQTVLLYRFGERYSAQRAAELMGKTEGAIKALQHRALGNLRRILGAAAHQ